MKQSPKETQERELRYKVRSERIHQQVTTNRKRHLSIEPIDDQIGWLYIETEVILTTTRHRSAGRLKLSNMTRSKCANHGLVSRYTFLDLVKPIFLRDIPRIRAEFEAGHSLADIRYSDWAQFKSSEKQASCDTMTRVKNALFASSLKTATLTNRVIKTVTSLIGF